MARVEHPDRDRAIVRARVGPTVPPTREDWGDLFARTAAIREQARALQAVAQQARWRHRRHSEVGLAPEGQ